MKFVTPYNGENKKVSIEFNGISLTDQACKDECDIGFIIENFVKTGQLPHQPQMSYQDCTSATSFEEAQLLVSQCKTDFELLPASERDKFGSVVGWLEYVNDQANLKDCLEKGYIAESSLTEEQLYNVYPERKPVETPVAQVVETVSTPVETPIVNANS